MYRKPISEPTAKQGFTLLELSIVLVIIGLIVGGVTTGADLIKAAQLNSVVTEANQFQVAFNTFKLKYNDIPGDMDNAEAYWGTADAADASCITTVSTGTETCNGDGDGKIEYGSTRSNESLRAWQHLANAGLLKGSFIGANATANVYVFGNEYPASAYSNTGWGIAHNTNWLGLTGHILLHSGAAAAGVPWEGGLNPNETMQVDSKIDDGLADGGKLRSIYGKSFGPAYGGKCTTGVAGDFDYELSSELQSCHFKYVID